MRLVTSEVWAEINRSRSADRSPVVVVSAFATKDHLGLKKGDVLICDASERVIRGGGTSAKALCAINEQGAKVYSLPGLHAKMVRLSGSVYVGSSNMTANTMNLHEAMIFSDDADLLVQVDSYVSSLLGLDSTECLSADMISDLCKIPVVAKPLSLGGGEGGDLVVDGERYFVVHTKDVVQEDAATAYDFLSSNHGFDFADRAKYVDFYYSDFRENKIDVGDRLVNIHGKDAYGFFEVVGVFRMGDPEGSGDRVLVLYSSDGARVASARSAKVILKKAGVLEEVEMGKPVWLNHELLAGMQILLETGRNYSEP